MHFYQNLAGELNRKLRDAISSDDRKAIHKRQASRHFLVVARQLALLVALPLIIYQFEEWYIWIPASILLGFVVFSFSVLLHEVVHKVVFSKPRPKTNQALGFFYGLVSGLSASQFTKWHMDHHYELGSDTADPKRFHLSPKINARWLKILYATPGLFFIYFRAAAKAAKTYAKPLQARIKKERILVIGTHLAVLVTFWLINPIFAVRAYIIPIFFVFPFAFTLNRLGQHYIINPKNMAEWSTLVRPNWIWNFLFIHSSYHLEHHYFPGVPFYHLKKCQELLIPFYAEEDIKPYSYGEMIRLWIFKNHKPHSKPI